MAQIAFEIQDSVAMALAFARGWTPTIEDTTQEMVGDSFPHIPNPVSFQQHASGVAAAFMSEYVLLEGRKAVATEFQSIHNNIEHQLNSGAFDALILAGNIQGIKDAVKASL